MVVYLSMQADVDNELERVFVDVGSLPTIVQSGPWRFKMCHSAIDGFLPG